MDFSTAHTLRAHQGTTELGKGTAGSLPGKATAGQPVFEVTHLDSAGSEFYMFQQLPLIISVTGHRDPHPTALPEIETVIRALFKDLQTAYPHTPLILLSMLAQGADILAARIGLEMGVRLIVPLPLPLDIYRQDFDDAQTESEFESLLSRAEARFTLPLMEGSTLEAVSVPGEARDKQYALGGAFLARQCQILIAFWDGADNGKTGGTAQVVNFKMRDIPEPYAQTLATLGGVQRSRLDAAEVGPVYQIVTPREAPSASGQAISLVKRFRHEDTESAETAFDRICANIDSFNADTLHMQRNPRLQARVPINAAYLIAPETLATLPPDAQFLCHDFAIADTLAQEYQKRVLNMLQILFGFVFAAAVMLEIYSDILLDRHILLLSYCLLLGAASAAWYYGLKKNKAQDRYQDYRAFAEGLRVAFFWRVAALHASVADHYLRKQKSELDWIRIALRNASSQWRVPASMSAAASSTAFSAAPSTSTPVSGSGAEMADPHAPLSEEETRRRMDIVARHWVEDQRSYFAKSAPRDERKAERFEHWVKRLFAVSFLVATFDSLLLLTPAIGHFVHEFDETHFPHLHSLMVIGIVLPAVAGASLHTYSDKLALSQHAKQYKRMQNLFTTASERLKEHLHSGAYGPAHDLVHELGKEALAENGDWVMMHRERPVEVPQG